MKRSRSDSVAYDIDQGLRLRGYSVCAIQGLVAGAPDRIAARAVINHLLEYKTEKGKQRPAQTKFQRLWHGCYHLVRNAEDAAVQMIACEYGR